jgi:hypothetical protein
MAKNFSLAPDGQNNRQQLADWLNGRGKAPTQPTPPKGARLLRRLPDLALPFQGKK